jgi:hypothetical protein
MVYFYMCATKEWKFEQYIVTISCTLFLFFRFFFINFKHERDDQVNRIADGLQGAEFFLYYF